jgi:hypothetical protein
MRQPAEERQRRPVLAPSGISLAGRTVVYATVANRPERYWSVLAELSALARDGEVITAASIFGGGPAYRTAAERIEAYYAKLGQLLSSGDVLVVLPADDGTLGSSLWNTMVVAQQRATDILVVAPTGHLRYLDQVQLEVLPEGRPYGEASRAWAKVHWRASRAFPRLAWAAPARDREPGADASGSSHPVTFRPRLYAQGARNAVQAEPEEDVQARAEAAAVAAKTPKGAAKAAANLARGRAARAAAAEARDAVLAGGGSEAEASAAATVASAGVMRRPLEEFMTAEQRAAARQLASPQPAPPPPVAVPTELGELADADWSPGELKALRQVRRPAARQRVMANLLRGRAAKAAAEQARTRSEIAGADPEKVEVVAREASMRVLARPLEEFMPGDQDHG